MKKLSLYVLLVLMWCNVGNALPKCKGNDDTQWTNCQGTYQNKKLPEHPDFSREYTGEFGSVPGKRHGKGSSKVFENGSFYLTYVGEFKDDKPNGQGTHIYANGNKHVGGYKEGRYHGQGTFTWADGDKYVGEYKDGNRHGQGTYTWTTGEKYVGEFKDNKKNGQGTYTYAEGGKYVGEYKDGKQHGQGTLIRGGAKYVGGYNDGKFHGQGTITYVDGTFEKGIYDMGELVKPN